jgi:outer membrane cobalamin receptor
VRSIIKKKMISEMPYLKATWALLFLCQFSEPAFSQEKTDSIASMDEVTVTATRRSAQTSKLPYSIAVLSREDASRQLSRTVPELSLIHI